MPYIVFTFTVVPIDFLKTHIALHPVHPTNHCHKLLDAFMYSYPMDMIKLKQNAWTLVFHFMIHYLCHQHTSCTLYICDYSQQHQLPDTCIYVHFRNSLNLIAVCCSKSYSSTIISYKMRIYLSISRIVLNYILYHLQPACIFFGVKCYYLLAMVVELWKQLYTGSQSCTFNSNRTNIQVGFIIPLQ